MPLQGACYVLWSLSLVWLVLCLGNFLNVLVAEFDVLLKNSFEGINGILGEDLFEVIPVSGVEELAPFVGCMPEIDVDHDAGASGGVCNKIKRVVVGARKFGLGSD